MCPDHFDRLPSGLDRLEVGEGMIDARKTVHRHRHTGGFQGSAKILHLLAKGIVLGIQNEGRGKSVEPRIENGANERIRDVDAVEVSGSH